MQGASECLSDSTNVSGIHHAENGNSSAATIKVNSDERKFVALRQLLSEDPLAADVKWSLFTAACQSYRYDSCLRPFPPQFVKNGNKDIDTLREIVDKTPSFTVLLQQLQNPEVCQSNQQVYDLLYWVLIHFKDTWIETVPKRQFGVVLSHVRCDTPVQQPNYIFEVKRSEESVQENKWRQLAHGRKTLYAFHGSRLENFHSILHHGLQQHLNKNALFGRGIYLASELSVSLPYSPMGYAWGRSRLGSQISCVALCEMVDHHDVKCQIDESDKTRALTSDSIGGEVPKKYFVVVNSDLVRVRYVLVYSQQTNFSRETSGSLLNWLANHKLLTLVIAYIVLLASVGLSNNQYVQRYFKIFLHRAGFSSRGL